MSTTIRVDTETHATLIELAAQGRASLMDTVREAAEALRRQRFATRVVEQLQALRQDEAAWTNYLSDADSTEVGDGIR